MHITSIAVSNSTSFGDILVIYYMEMLNINFSLCMFALVVYNLYDFCSIIVNDPDTTCMQ